MMLCFMVLLTLLVFKDIVEVQGVVTNLDCDGVNNMFTANGTSVTFNCTVQTVSVTWSVPFSGDAIEFTSNDRMGDTEAMGLFNATYVQEGPPGISTLSFTLDPSLNGTTVTCEDGGLPGSQSCTILVTSSPRAPLALTNISGTYESVEIQWSVPSFNGGSNITQYHISVNPSPADDQSTCSGGQCTTTGLSFNITGLIANVQYQFTVSAENSAGIGDSATVNVSTIGVALPPLTDAPHLCLNYTADNGLMLMISWNCSSAVSNAITPPLTNYTVCINNDCALMESVDSCSTSVPVNCNDTYSVSVILFNEIGPSNSNQVATINTDLLGSLIVNSITNVSATINYSPFSNCNDFTSGANTQIELTNVNTGSSLPLQDYTIGSVDITSLNASTLYTYSLQVLTVDGEDVCNGTQLVIGQFTTAATGDTGGGDTTAPSTTPTTTTDTITTSPTSSPTPASPQTGGLGMGAIIGIGAGGGILLIVIVAAGGGGGAVYFIYFRPRKGQKANFSRHDRNSDEPIALVNRTEQTPETGYDPAIALYAEPDKPDQKPSANIRHEEPAPGVLYAQPDKPSRRNPPPQPHQPPPSQPELATYQDPNTIQREPAPTGDLYALPEKKPVYTEVNKNKTGIVYAALELKDNPSATPAADDKPSIDVVYADVKKP